MLTLATIIFSSNHAKFDCSSKTSEHLCFKVLSFIFIASEIKSSFLQARMCYVFSSFKLVPVLQGTVVGYTFKFQSVLLAYSEPQSPWFMSPIALLSATNKDITFPREAKMKTNYSRGHTKLAVLKVSIMASPVNYVGLFCHLVDKNILNVASKHHKDKNSE